MDVILPWRDNGCPHRRAHFWHLHWWWSRHFRVIVGDCEGPFNRSAARNNGVAQSSHADVVAVIDADNLIHPAAVWEAGFRAQKTGRLVKPFNWFGYLDLPTTDAWYAGTLPRLLESPDPAREAGYEGGPPQTGFNGGAYVMRRDAWAQTGGFDEGFTGWGAEDDAFTLHTQRLIGPVLTIPGVAYHLWHPTPGRVTSPENYQRLMERYVHGHQSS